jgi:hypothetical protein
MRGRFWELQVYCEPLGPTPHVAEQIRRRCLRRPFTRYLFCIRCERTFSGPPNSVQTFSYKPSQFKASFSTSIYCRHRWPFQLEPPWLGCIRLTGRSSPTQLVLLRCTRQPFHHPGPCSAHLPTCQACIISRCVSQFREARTPSPDSSVWRLPLCAIRGSKISGAEVTTDTATPVGGLHMSTMPTDGASPLTSAIAS